MTFELCIKTGKINSLTTGSMNFRTSTMDRHAKSSDHQNALKDSLLNKDFTRAQANAFKEHERKPALISAMRSVYCMATIFFSSNSSILIN